MRAVNLIPADSVRGGGAGGSGPIALLGGLGLLLVLVTVYVLSSNTVVDRRVERDALRVQVAQAQAQAEQVRPYREFAVLARARVDTIRQLGSARFDWHRAFADISTVIPDNVWLTSLTGTVTTGVTVGGGGSGGASALRAAIPNPAIEMSGCTVDHESVVRLVSRLRLLRTVQRVSLADSSKDGGGDCQHGNTNFPVFDLVVFFAPIPTVAPPATPSATPVAATGAGDTTGATPPPTSSPAPSGAVTPPNGGNG